MKLLNASPVSAKKSKKRSYLIQKADRTAQNLKRTWGVANECNSDFVPTSDDALDMILRLKATFHENDISNAEKIQILTLMPSTWSTRKTSQVMNTSEYMARLAKNLAKTDSVLSMPEAKPRKITLVIRNLKFYDSINISAKL